MRVLHVIPSLDPAGGGPPMVASRLAAAQADLGHEVSVFAYREPEAQARIEAMFQALPCRERIGIVGPTRGGRIERLLARAAGSQLNGLVADFDILHLHGVWESFLVVAAAAARRAGTPYVVAPHGMLDPWSLAQRKWKKSLALALVHRRMLNGASFLHVLNADERDLLAPLALRTPAEVIPNGVFLGEVDPLPPRGRFRAAHPEVAQDPFVFFMSRLHFKKGLDFLAAAFQIVQREMPSARLVVAGPDGGERATFEARCRALGVHDRTHVVGPLYGAAKFEALVDAAVFCLPSRQEGFSMAITEAMASSVPVVISPACHFPEVADAGAGRIVPLEASQIAAAILELLRDEGERARCGASGRALVTSTYTWPVIARACLDAYERHAAA